MSAKEPDNELIDQYYSIVKQHLESLGTWNETASKFPPSTIKGTVKEILDRLYQNNMPADSIDWSTLFEKLRDYGHVNDFLKWAESEHYIPINYEKVANEVADDSIRQLSEILDSIKGSNSVRLKNEVKQMVQKYLGTADEINKLKRETEANKKESDKYSALLKQQTDFIEQLRYEIQQLKEQLQKAQQPALPEGLPLGQHPLSITYDTVWQMFCDELKQHNINCSQYEKDENVQNELKTAARARSEEEARTIVQDLASSIVTKPASTPGRGAQTSTPSPVAGRVSRGRIFVAPSSIPMPMIKQALETGGLAAGFGASEIGAIADRLGAIGQLMQLCQLPGGESYESCVQATNFAGKVLQTKSHEIAMYGLKYLSENAETFGSSLKQFAMTSITGLGNVFTQAMVMSRPIAYWLGIVAEYELAIYFNIYNIRDQIQGEYETFKRFVNSNTS